MVVKRLQDRDDHPGSLEVRAFTESLSLLLAQLAGLESLALQIPSQEHTTCQSCAKRGPGAPMRRSTSRGSRHSPTTRGTRTEQTGLVKLRQTCLQRHGECVRPLRQCPNLVRFGKCSERHSTTETLLSHSRLKSHEAHGHSRTRREVVRQIGCR